MATSQGNECGTQSIGQLQSKAYYHTGCNESHLGNFVSEGWLLVLIIGRFDVNSLISSHRIS